MDRPPCAKTGCVRSYQVFQALGAFVVALLLVATLPRGSDARAPQQPLSQDEVVNLLKQGVAPSEIEKLARQHGISFEVTEGAKKRLGEAGAPGSLVSALSQLPARSTDQVKQKLTVEAVMELLSGGVPLPRVTYLVKERGVDFDLTPRLEGAFRDSGADPGLLLAMRGNLPAAPRDRTLESKPSTPPNREAPPISSDTQTPSKPAPLAKLAVAAPEETHSAGLRIQSQPANVSIFLDDQPKGATDAAGRLEIIPVEPGKHRLRAALDGYREVEGPVEVAAGQVLETPIWLAKAEANAPPEASTSSLSAGKRFLVRHRHVAYAGEAGPAYCQGWMVVNVGYVRYISTDSPHIYLMGTSEMRDAKAAGSHGSFTIKLDFGRQYQFTAVDEKGKEVSAGPILSEIKYSMGQ